MGSITVINNTNVPINAKIVNSSFTHSFHNCVQPGEYYVHTAAGGLQYNLHAAYFADKGALFATNWEDLWSPITGTAFAVLGLAAAGLCLLVPPAGVVAVGAITAALSTVGTVAGTGLSVISLGSVVVDQSIKNLLDGKRNTSLWTDIWGYKDRVFSLEGKWVFERDPNGKDDNAVKVKALTDISAKEISRDAFNQLVNVGSINSVVAPTQISQTDFRDYQKTLGALNGQPVKGELYEIWNRKHKLRLISSLDSDGKVTVLESHDLQGHKNWRPEVQWWRFKDDTRPNAIISMLDDRRLSVASGVVITTPAKDASKPEDQWSLEPTGDKPEDKGTFFIRSNTGDKPYLIAEPQYRNGTVTLGKKEGKDVSEQWYIVPRRPNGDEKEIAKSKPKYGPPVTLQKGFRLRTQNDKYLGAFERAYSGRAAENENWPKIAAQGVSLQFLTPKGRKPSDNPLTPITPERTVQILSGADLEICSTESGLGENGYLGKWRSADVYYYSRDQGDHQIWRVFKVVPTNGPILSNESVYLRNLSNNEYLVPGDNDVYVSTRGEPYAWIVELA